MFSPVFPIALHTEEVSRQMHNEGKYVGSRSGPTHFSTTEHVSQLLDHL